MEPNASYHVPWHGPLSGTARGRPAKAMEPLRRKWNCWPEDRLHAPVHAPAAAPQHTCPRPAAPQHALQKPLAGCHPILTRTISRYELCSNTNPWSARHGILPPFGKAKVCTNRTRLPGPKPQPNCKFPMLDIATPEATNLAVPPVRQHYKNSVLQIATVSPSSQHLLNSVGRAPPKVWVQLPIW